MKICLITPNHISTNPRLVKECIAFERRGFGVHIIFTQSNRFETILDRSILNQHPAWTYDVLDWSGKGLHSYFVRNFSGLQKKFSEKLFFSSFKVFAHLIVNRNYFWQLKKAIAVNADLFIAHNLGALPVAKAAAGKLGAKFGFDAEDFHRFETTNNPSDTDVILKSTVEAENIGAAHHFTAASPLIAKAYQQLFPFLRPTVILNVFPKTKSSVPKKTGDHKLRLFWFSQTLGENRGIETIIAGLSLTTTAICELHLLGNYTLGYKEKLEQLVLAAGERNAIFFYNPVPENEIFELASNFDIGMASETGEPYNRDICLTNKIFTYIQSGLAVVASDTSAQLEFIGSSPAVGKIYQKNNPGSLASILDHYFSNRVELENCKADNFQLGQTSLNWEVEQDKLVRSIETVFG